MTAGAAPGGARIRVLVREDCHLCEAAMEVVRTVCAETGEDYEVVDVDGEPELRARYTDEVPVTFVDGRQHSVYRVDSARLRTALAG